jgi:hypothetical protein
MEIRFCFLSSISNRHLDFLHLKAGELNRIIIKIKIKIENRFTKWRQIGSLQVCLK